ncbi:TetR/AcrR family transcriptional regulator [Amycolatopsis albispora]|uniref:TetR family transcriptional regulator n=1 Tax=Amycolatopsis albispora TaxID=1804986 RepID=A0A344L8V8_9PSEU|nr:TetR/AcrR family transcriptional regulator [Amycolatopsis albispora]AXB44482.1 TetR family transcriptional regulator [Amycolatopsis albispora]
MPELPEHGSPKAARILAAAGELLLSRGCKGFTVADVATRAHVGKGTVYLYWKTKEELLVGLIGRDFLGLADDVTARVTADPDLARPSRLCSDMLRVGAEHPFVRALQHGDDDLLGVLAEDPRSVRLLDTLGPEGVMRAILPVWRANGLARADWPLEDQVLALQALTTGFIALSANPANRRSPAELERVFAESVTALLGPERATARQLQATVTDGLAYLAKARATALDLITQSAAA